MEANNEVFFTEKTVAINYVDEYEDGMKRAGVVVSNMYRGRCLEEANNRSRVSLPGGNLL